MIPKMIIAMIIAFMVLVAGCTNVKFSKSEKTVIEKIHVVYYFSPTCSYCTQESAMFDNLSMKYPNKFELEKFNVNENESLWIDVLTYSKKYNTTDNGIPFIIIGDKAFSGFTPNNSEQIETIISGKE